jgi:hypothetical protein
MKASLLLYVCLLNPSCVTLTPIILDNTQRQIFSKVLLTIPCSDATCFIGSDKAIKLSRSSVIPNYSTFLGDLHKSSIMPAESPQFSNSSRLKQSTPFAKCSKPSWTEGVTLQLQKNYSSIKKKRDGNTKKTSRLIPDGLIFHQLTHKTRIKI